MCPPYPDAPRRGTPRKKSHRSSSPPSSTPYGNNFALLLTAGTCVTLPLNPAARIAMIAGPLRIAILIGAPPMKTKKREYGF